MEIYLAQDDQRTGPHTPAELQALVSANKIDRSCPAWREGMPDWLPLEEVVPLLAPSPPPFPAGLPPVPTQRIKVGLRQEVRSSNETFDGTKPDSAGKQHSEKIIAFIGGFVIIFLAFSCHHK